MKNPVPRSALIGAASALAAIIVAVPGAFLLPIPNGEHFEFLFYVLLLFGMPVGTLLTLMFLESPGTGGLWNAVAIAGLLAVLNWTVIGILYGVLRRWLTKRKRGSQSSV